MTRSLLRLGAPAFFVLAVLCAAGIHALSALPGRAFGAVGPVGGFLFNLAHAPLFGLLCFFLSLALARRGAPPELPRKRMLAAVALTLAYACCDEWHQSLVEGRSASAADAVTDFAGAALAALFVRLALDARADARRRVALLLPPALLAVASALWAAA